MENYFLWFFMSNLILSVMLMQLNENRKLNLFLIEFRFLLNNYYHEKVCGILLIISFSNYFNGKSFGVLMVGWGCISDDETCRRKKQNC